jgi:phosphatidylcholine synthase
MNARIGAACVHLLTATGAALALLALHAAASANWQKMFVWLGLALIVDGIDGPLARLVKVETVLPRWSGERLDLIVDYLTYVAIPAFALTRAELLPEAFRLPAGIAIMLSSLFHVADRDSKTKDGYFVGFPAIWNVVLLYLFALMPRPSLALAVILILILFTFVPIHYVHPLRVSRWRGVTLLVTGLWSVAAIGAVMSPFPSPLWVQLLLALAAAYFIAAGILRWRRGGGGGGG